MRVEDISVYAEGQLLLSGPDDGLAIYDLQARQIRRRVQKVRLSPYLQTFLLELIAMRSSTADMVPITAGIPAAVRA